MGQILVTFCSASANNLASLSDETDIDSNVETEPEKSETLTLQQTTPESGDSEQLCSNEGEQYPRITQPETLLRVTSSQSIITEQIQPSTTHQEYIACCKHGGLLQLWNFNLVHCVCLVCGLTIMDESGYYCPNACPLWMCANCYTTIKKRKHYSADLIVANVLIIITNGIYRYPELSFLQCARILHYWLSTSFGSMYVPFELVLLIKQFCGNPVVRCRNHKTEMIPSMNITDANICVHCGKCHTNQHSFICPIVSCTQQKCFDCYQKALDHPDAGDINGEYPRDMDRMFGPSKQSSSMANGGRRKKNEVWRARSGAPAIVPIRRREDAVFNI